MSDTWDVELYVYDLSQGMAAMMSMPLLGFQLEAIYHTAIVYNGVEFFFGGGGIDQSRPGGTHLGAPMRRVKLGKTEIDPCTFNEWIRAMASSEYRGDTYAILTHNCNNFSEDASQFLVQKSIPSEILEMPKKVLGTPLGKIIEQQFGNIKITPEQL